ncbi:MAG: YihY family inner membrane protein, partial [Burkholderiales bacterium]
MPQPEMIPRNFRELTAFLRAALARFVEDRCLQIAGSLTYTSLLSLVPLLTVALSLITAFPVFADWTGEMDDFMVENVLPEAIGNAVATYITQFTQKAARLTAVGIVILAATALMLMLTIDRAFNQIFRVPRQRPVVPRVLMYWAVLTLGPILFGASISMTSYLVSASLGLAKGLGIFGEMLLRLVPVILTAAATTLLYLAVP